MADEHLGEKHHELDRTLRDWDGPCNVADVEFHNAFDTGTCKIGSPTLGVKRVVVHALEYQTEIRDLDLLDVGVAEQIPPARRGTPLHG